MSDFRIDASSLVLARRDPKLLDRFRVLICLRHHLRAPDWSAGLARVQQVARGEPQLGFWVGEAAPQGSYIVDFDAGGDPPGFRGIWRVLGDEPVVATSEGSVLLARRTQRIDGFKIGSHQTWRRAVGAARWSAGVPAMWELGQFAVSFLSKSPPSRSGYR